MRFIGISTFILVGLIMFSGCNQQTEREVMDSVAVKYVKLVLKVGNHDASMVDAYHGPEEWLSLPGVDSDTAPIQLDSLELEAEDLLSTLEGMKVSKEDTLLVYRKQYLIAQLTAVKARISMLMGSNLDFDTESRLVYGAESPRKEYSAYDEALRNIDAVLPGEGTLSDRFKHFRKDFLIPEEKLDTVFRTAIAECRKRTKEHITLPENEEFTLEYVKDKPWGGYNWFKGDAFSLIQINTDLPIQIDRAIDLAGHEGYPGHHVYNTLLEKHMLGENNFIEFCIYPLYSPMSLIAEGTANYGIKVVFPGDERIRYEKEVLFPLAGIDSSKADEYYMVQRMMKRLSFAGNEVAREYLNGDIDRQEANELLQKYLIMTPERADMRLKFIDAYRAYTITYNVGEEMVKEYIERNGGVDSDSERRWEIFADLLSKPYVPSDLLP